MPPATDPDPTTTVVAGAGWAGLAAAVSLSRQGHPVTLMESAKQAGGRARSVDIDRRQLDNGQHLMIGAYDEMLQLLRAIGVEEETVLLRRPMRLLLRALQGDDIELRMAPLPAPLHMAGAILLARGLDAGDKWRALRLCLRLQRHRFTIAVDCSLHHYLRSEGQSEFLIRNLWTPLCLGALNTPPQLASTQLFLQVLKQSFSGNRHHSDLLLAKCNLGNLLPQPALAFLSATGSRVRLQQRVTALCIEQGRLQGIECDGEFIPARQLVLALPPWHLPQLLRDHAVFAPLVERLQQLKYQPICTVYLQYAADIRLPLEMTGVRDGISQWVFDRRVCGQPGLMAVVISADGPHMEWDNDSLAQRVQAELAQLFPHWPQPQSQHVIREKRATFGSHVHVNRVRPDQRTPVAGCWLAGDYTATGLPATLEGAIASGVQCARLLLAAAATEDTP